MKNIHGDLVMSTESFILFADGQRATKKKVIIACSLARRPCVERMDLRTKLKIDGYVTM